MIVAIIQPNYLPWRGYFDIIDDADIFIILDDVQFSKGSWRNRNRIKTRLGTTWMTVPVKASSLTDRICDVHIDNSLPWRQRHLGLVTENYADAPHFATWLPRLEEEWNRPTSRLVDLDVRTLQVACDHLSISTPLVRSSSLNVTGTKTERLIRLIKMVEGDHYLSGPSARAYLDERRLNDAGIELHYKSYEYDAYPQLWGHFIEGLSIVDLLMNAGDQARLHLKSRP